MKKQIKWLSAFLVFPAALAAVWFLGPRLAPPERFGFDREVSQQEAALRRSLVDTACGWAGVREDDGTHRPIIDIYNTLDPLPQDYRVTYGDAWCAAFVTAAAIETELTDIIPPECSCTRQIRCFQELDTWAEDDGYTPLPGDVIYYDWDASPFGDCTGWPDHEGIVVGTYGPFIRVIEGNRDDDAGFRTIWKYDWRIRGYGVPDYTSKAG